jgi:hypothetical protein
MAGDRYGAEHMSTRPEPLLETFGLSLTEILAARNLALDYIGSANVLRGMREFTDAAPDADKRKSLAARRVKLSTAGLGAVIDVQRGGLHALDSFETLLNRVLFDPPNYRDWADWWLFFTALAAGTAFQLERCTSGKREQRLTGHLLEALASEAKIWSQPLAPAFTRSNATLAISDIDLEVGGGEQATGGDFGLILDFDGRTAQPGSNERGEAARIVPLLFQAKRFERPTANVSQSHRIRGPQRNLLASNKCASAYIFYDNLGEPATPLPPLVKPVDKVPHATETNVLQDSLDFATYLLVVASDDALAPRARSPDDALRMIFSKAKLRDLSALVVVSADPDAPGRYRRNLSMLRPQLLDRGEDSETVEDRH